MRQRGVQIGAPFKVPSYLAHPLVVPSLRFHTLVSNAYDAPCFASSLGDAPSLRSVTGGMLSRFAQLLGGCSLASLSHWGDSLSLHSVAGGAPRFASLLSIKLFHRIANLVVSMHMTMASLLALKFRSAHREQIASLIARSSSFFLLAQETTAFAHLLGGLCARACGPAVELGIPHPF